MEQSLVTFSLRFKYDCGTSAASYAIRNISVGYLYECLPLSWTRLIISRRNNMFCFALKEVILRQSDKAEYQGSGDEKILKLLFNHFESEEEGVSNVETERLGNIALIETLLTFPQAYDDYSIFTFDGVKQSYQRQQLASEVKLINSGKILENDKTVGQCKMPFGDNGSGVIIMHVVVQPSLAKTKTEKKIDDSPRKIVCSCSIM